MKKLFAIVAAIAIATSAFAEGASGFKIGAGYSINPYSYNYSATALDPASTNGYHVFVNYPFVITEVSSVTVGLRWEQTFNDLEVLTIKNKFTRGFVSLPVKYEAHFGGFFFNVGPTVSYWALYKDVIGSADTKVTVNMFEDETGYNRVDVAAGVEFGYDFDHVRVFAGYDYGFLKGVKSSDYNFNRHQVRIGLGFIF